jgi:methionyl-tRNA synthetase
MIERYFEGVVPEAAEYTEQDLGIQTIVGDAAANADAAIERFRIDEAISDVWTIVDALNGYITDNEPWALAKDQDQRERLGTVLYTCAEGLRALAVLLSPVMPLATSKLWDALGAEGGLGALTAQPLRDAGRWGQLPTGTTVQTLAPLFPRIEATA